jgi:hypothetical protein
MWLAIAFFFSRLGRAIQCWRRAAVPSSIRLWCQKQFRSLFYWPNEKIWYVLADYFFGFCFILLSTSCCWFQKDESKNSHERNHEPAGWLFSYSLSLSVSFALSTFVSKCHTVLWWEKREMRLGIKDVIQSFIVHWFYLIEHIRRYTRIRKLARIEGSTSTLSNQQIRAGRGDGTVNHLSVLRGTLP